MTNEQERTDKCDMEMGVDNERRREIGKMTDTAVRNGDLKRKYLEDHTLSKKLCLSFQNEDIAVMHELDKNPSSSINMLDINPNANFPLDIDVRSAIINLHEISKPTAPNQWYKDKGEGSFVCKIDPNCVDIEMPEREISLRIPVSQINKVQCHVRKNLLPTKKSSFIIFFHLDSSAYQAVEASFCGYQDNIFNETTSATNHNILTIVAEKITKGILRKIQNDIKTIFRSMYEEINMDEAIHIIKLQRGKTDPNFMTQNLLPLTPSPSQPLSPSNLLPVSSFNGNSHLIFGPNGLPAAADADSNYRQESGENSDVDDPKAYDQMDFSEQEINANAFTYVDNRLGVDCIKCEEEPFMIKEEDVKCEIEEEPPDIKVVEVKEAETETESFSLECSIVRIGSYLATQDNTTSFCTINSEDGERTIQLCLQGISKTETFDIPQNQIDRVLTHFGHQKVIWLYLKHDACLRILKALFPTQDFWMDSIPESDRKVTIISPNGYADHVKKLLLITKLLRSLFGERFSELKKHEATMLLNETRNDNWINELSNSQNWASMGNLKTSFLTEKYLNFDENCSNIENGNAISNPIPPSRINGFYTSHQTRQSQPLLKNHKSVLWAQATKPPVCKDKTRTYKDKTLVYKDKETVKREKLKESFLCQSIKIGTFTHTSTSMLKSSCDIVNKNIEINLPNTAASGTAKLLKIPCKHVTQVLGFFGEWQVLFIFLNGDASNSVDKELSLNGGFWPDTIPAGERHISIIPDKNSWNTSGTTHQERVTNLGQLFSGKLQMIDMNKATTMMEQNHNMRTKHFRKIIPSTPISPKMSEDTPISLPKPECTYRCLAALAILSSPSACMQVKDIHNFICTQFPFFESGRKPKSLKNVIQTTLCKQRCFTNILTEGNNQAASYLWGISSKNPWNFTDVSNYAGTKKPPSIIKEFVDLLTQGIKKGMANPLLFDQWITKSCSLTSNITSTNNILIEHSSSETNVNQNGEIIENQSKRIGVVTPDIEDISASSDKSVNMEVQREGNISPPLGVISIDVFSIRFGCHELSTFQSVSFGGQPCQFVVSQSCVTIGVPTQGDVGHPNSALNSVNVPISGIRRVDAYVGKLRQLLFLHLVPKTGDFVKEALAIKTSEPLELISIIPVKGRKTSKSSLQKWFSQFKPSFGSLLHEIDLPEATSMLKLSQDNKKANEETSV